MFKKLMLVGAFIPITMTASAFAAHSGPDEINVIDNTDNVSVEAQVGPVERDVFSPVDVQNGLVALSTVKGDVILQVDNTDSPSASPGVLQLSQGHPAVVGRRARWTAMERLPSSLWNPGSGDAHSGVTERVVFLSAYLANGGRYPAMECHNRGT